MDSPYTVADLVADFLPQVGVRTVFGIVSVHNIPMLDAIGRRNTLRYVMARGEMGGAHMADAYARVTGHLGVLFTSHRPRHGECDPGAGRGALRRFSPVLHITGQTATKHIDRDAGTVHDVPGQTAMLAAACKAAYRVRSANEAFGVLVRAAAEALSAPRGPVSVEIPIDLQRAVDRAAGGARCAGTADRGAAAAERRRTGCGGGDPGWQRSGRCCGSAMARSRRARRRRG